jgi:signal peptidase II
MVVDFLDFYLGRFHWPAFNVADTAICIGLGLVFLDLFIINESEKDDKVLSNRKSTG